jgi:beta-fructofuranosidase
MKAKQLILILAITFVACSESQSGTEDSGEAKKESESQTQVPQEDYTSKVPKFTFANTIEEQEEQLKTNPLMLRFRESRKKLAKDPHVPLYHFVSPENRLNDPNGLSFWQGRWHLFYQGSPPEDPRQHWGHAVSDDLIHWEDLPYAIYPNPERDCFSGSALVEDDRVIAMYHGTRVGNMVAVSSDPLLLNWEKVTGKPVIKSPSDGEELPYNIFDPCIWKKDGTYYSLSAGRKNEGPGGKPIRANFLFRSNDLENWEYLHPFVEDDRFTNVWDDGACPYFWPIGDRHILPFFSHTSGGQYLLGDYDQGRDKFVVTAHGLFNFGAWGPGGIHAPSATPDGKGAVIIIFNMNPGRPTEGWDQLMSLPRRLTLLSEDRVGMEPAGDIESLRYDHQQVGPMTLPANKDIVLESIRGNAMEIIAEIDPKEAPTIEVDVLRSPNKEEFTRISFFKQRGYRDWERYAGWEWAEMLKAKYSLITLASSHSSILPDVMSRAPETGSFYLGPDETLKLRIFIDKSVVEVFANGKQCVAVRVYPGLEDSVGVSLRSQGQDSQLLSLDAWQMKSIYGE